MNSRPERTAALYPATTAAPYCCTSTTKVIALVTHHQPDVLSAAFDPCRSLEQPERRLVEHAVLPHCQRDSLFQTPEPVATALCKTAVVFIASLAHPERKYPNSRQPW